MDRGRKVVRGTKYFQPRAPEESKGSITENFKKLGPERKSNSSVTTTIRNYFSKALSIFLGRGGKSVQTALRASP
ncbi:hypothetical protein Enr13x_62460 [Stieleria neptunia]|uniref:Uncharacterized protein n=1 Tax=Stieleria neptunia TaxID=2527979 RepID=A0A518HZZ4_9BACT|nr:hypothetical protein Enr13x_62460 [Stieleria neptunia]